MAEKTRILVVADRTADSDELLEALQSRAAEQPVAFMLLVPPVPQGMSRIGGPDPDETESEQEEAEQSLEAGVKRLRGAGLEVEGRLGDPDPVAAAEDAVNFEEFDEIIVSTEPRHLSKWLRVDLPRRIEGATGRSVTHISASE